jgi:hypothetical protein
LGSDVGNLLLQVIATDLRVVGTAMHSTSSSPLGAVAFTENWKLVGLLPLGGVLIWA